MEGVLLHRYLAERGRHILGMAADRFGLEISFRECERIVRAGQLQVRFIWGDVGAARV